MQKRQTSFELFDDNYNHSIPDRKLSSISKYPQVPNNNCVPILQD